MGSGPRMVQDERTDPDPLSLDTFRRDVSRSSRASRHDEGSVTRWDFPM